MGGHAYWYFVPYKKSVQAALDDLRTREFKAGRYNPVMRFIEFAEPGFSRQKPGAKHRTIEEAIQDAAEDGTRSILDISRISQIPDYGAASPLPSTILQDLYGTDKPSREMLNENQDFFEDIERGQCAYVIVYKSGAPSEILFAGYSYD